MSFPSSRNTLPPLCKYLRSEFDETEGVIDYPINEECTSLKITPSGQLIIAGFSDGTLRLYDTTGTFKRNSQDKGVARDGTFDSKHHQRYGAVVAQIEAKGVHTSLLMDVDVSPDGLWAFAGVLRGSMEMVALYIGSLEKKIWKHSLQKQQKENDEESVPDVGNILDHCNTFWHADAKLRGFAACTRLRLDASTGPNKDDPKYLLATGKGVKNIHIWMFEPPSKKNKFEPVWTPLYDTPSSTFSGTSLVFMAFKHTDNGGLQALSKVHQQRLRVWDLSPEQEHYSADWSRPNRPEYYDVPQTESVQGIAGNLGLCGGPDLYHQVSIVSLDPNASQYNHTELLLPGASSAAEGSRSSRRQQRGDLQCITNAFGSIYDEGPAILQISDGSVVQYNPDTEPCLQVMKQPPMASTLYNTSNGASSLRPMCVARISKLGHSVVAVANFNSSRGLGHISLCMLEVARPKDQLKSMFWGYLALKKPKKVPSKATTPPMIAHQEATVAITEVGNKEDPVTEKRSQNYDTEASDSKHDASSLFDEKPDAEDMAIVKYTEKGCSNTADTMACETPEVSKITSLKSEEPHIDYNYCKASVAKYDIDQDSTHDSRSLTNTPPRKAQTTHVQAHVSPDATSTSHSIQLPSLNSKELEQANSDTSLASKDSPRLSVPQPHANAETATKLRPSPLPDFLYCAGLDTLARTLEAHMAEDFLTDGEAETRSTGQDNIAAATKVTERCNVAQPSSLLNQSMTTQSEMNNVLDISGTNNFATTKATDNYCGEDNSVDLVRNTDQVVIDSNDNHAVPSSASNKFDYQSASNENTIMLKEADTAQHTAIKKRKSDCLDMPKLLLKPKFKKIRQLNDTANEENIDKENTPKEDKSKTVLHQEEVNLTTIKTTERLKKLKVADTIESACQAQLCEINTMLKSLDRRSNNDHHTAAKDRLLRSMLQSGGKLLHNVARNPQASNLNDVKSTWKNIIREYEQAWVDLVWIEGLDMPSFGSSSMHDGAYKKKQTKIHTFVWQQAQDLIPTVK